MVVKVETLERFNIANFPRPEGRFDPTSGPSRDRQVFEPIIYHCKDCGYDVQFTNDDFGKHAVVRSSNLSEADQDLINVFKECEGIKSKYFLDFYCPRCRRAVCVIFEGGVAGRGEYFVDLQFVLEIR